MHFRCLFSEEHESRPSNLNDIKLGQDGKKVWGLQKTYGV